MGHGLSPEVELNGTARLVARQMINLRAPEPQSTIIAVGNGRGGTSLVAGTLDLLGVPMGRKDHSWSHEDNRILRFRTVHTNPDVSPADREIARRDLFEYFAANNARHDVWGWKDPSADLYLEDVIDQVRNPRIIFINRDPAAVAETTFLMDAALRTQPVERRPTAPAISIEQAYELALTRLNRYYMMVQKLGLPTLMFSYERAVRNPEGAVDALVAFCGITPDARRRERALAFAQAGKYQTTEHFQTPTAS